MKALVVQEKNRLEIVEIDPPQIGPYDALVRIEVCGICNSTDTKLVHGTMTWTPPFPFVIGHEGVGTVVEVGKKVRKFKVGDRVTRPQAFLGAREGLRVGAGGFAEYGVVRDGLAMAADGDPSLAKDYNVLRQNVVPTHLSPVEASLAIALSETASVLRYLPSLAGKKVIVAGTGVVGMSLGLWVKMAGGFVITLGRRAERLEQAKALGADVVINTREPGFLDAIREAAGGPVDGAIEATGDAPLAEQILSVLSEDAFASAYGVPPKGIGYAPRWKTSQVDEHLSYAWVADLLARGWVKPEWFVSHVWDWKDAVEAFAAVERGEVLKGFIKTAA